MKQILLICILGVLLSACGKTNSYYPRQYGQDWKVYPYIEGSAKKAGTEGRTCWAETNRPNWDHCY